MARLSLRTVGPFQATLDGEPVTGFESAKARALLVYLAVEAYRPHPREMLADLLWPDWPRPDALRNLRQCLFHLRNVIADRAADPPYFIISRESLQFNASSDYCLDIDAFTKALGIHDVSPDTIGALEDAVCLWRGDFTEGLFLDDSPGFEAWTLHLREQLRRELVAALRRLAGHYEERGAYDRAETYARREIELEPWDEEAHRRLMRILALGGQRYAALAHYDGYRHRLAQELGVDPGSETIALFERIRDGALQPDPTAHAPVLAPPLPPFLRAVRTEQSIPERGPAFVAREEELSQLRRSLGRALAGQGLVTFVTGEPGSGKSMLVQQFVRQAGEQCRQASWKNFRSLADFGSYDVISVLLSVSQPADAPRPTRCPGPGVRPESARPCRDPTP